VRASWSQFYGEVREFYVGLVTDAQRAGAIAEGETRRDVDLMLEAMEGLKIRAGFEKQIVDPSERQVISESLLSIFKG
jgi:hypothetical protein